MDSYHDKMSVKQQLPDNLILQMLHDDELYLIFKLLNVMELIEVEKVCQRFKAIAQDVYKSHKVLDFDRLSMKRSVNGIHYNFTVQEAMEIASRVGSYVEKLKISLFYIDDPRDRVSNIWMHFTNLQAMSVSDFRFTFINEGSISKILKNLKKMELQNDPPDSLPEDFLEIDFPEIPQLEDLKLICFYALEGNFLTKFSNITVLSLDHCNINPRYFRIFCDKNPKLRCLNISQCTGIDTMCLRSITDNLQNLEELSLSFNYQVDSQRDYFILAGLTKLKHLELNGTDFRGPEDNRSIMYNLLFAISTKNKLESLLIIDGDTGRTEDFQRAIKSLTHLKKLQLFPESIFEDIHLSYLPCEKTLQSLIIVYNKNITSQGLSQLIARCSAISFIVLEACIKVDKTLIDLILPHLKTRSHMLELKIDKEVVPKEKFGIYYGVNSSKLMLTF